MTHSPSSSELDMREFSLTQMEDRYVNPAILYIQVTVVKVIGHCHSSKFTLVAMVGYFMLLEISFNACP